MRLSREDKKEIYYGFALGMIWYFVILFYWLGNLAGFKTGSEKPFAFWLIIAIGIILPAVYFASFYRSRWSHRKKNIHVQKIGFAVTILAVLILILYSLVTLLSILPGGFY